MQAIATSSNRASNARRPPHHRHIWIVTGPAGCGKTAVAESLASAMQLPYLEGDAYHPPANVEKMSNNIPLTDADRWDWLVALREEAVQLLKVSAGSRNHQQAGVVLTCSALKRKYRDVIRIASYNDHQVLVHFIFLRADEAVLVQRVRGRKGHFMKDSMVHSQITSLEEPREDETDTLSIDVSVPLDAVKRQALGLIQQELARDQ